MCHLMAVFIVLFVYGKFDKFLVFDSDRSQQGHKSQHSPIIQKSQKSQEEPNFDLFRDIWYLITKVSQ